MAFPSTLSTFSTPNPTDKLSSPSHSGIEIAQNDAISQLEKVLGTSASTLGTIIGDLRNTTSAGGGHIQTAVKGGTGQTTFTKGDILVAQSASVLAKLAVGTNNQILTADSTANTGIKWIPDDTPLISASVFGSVVGQDVVTETSVLSVTIPGGTLSTNHAVRATVNGILAYEGLPTSIMSYATYGGDRVASVMLEVTPDGGEDRLSGKIEYVLIANGANDIQSAQLDVKFLRSDSATSIMGVAGGNYGTGSVNSALDQTMGVTWQFCDDDTSNKFLPKGVIVEKLT